MLRCEVAGVLVAAGVMGYWDGYRCWCDGVMIGTGDSKSPVPSGELGCCGAWVVGAGVLEWPVVGAGVLGGTGGW